MPFDTQSPRPAQVEGEGKKVVNLEFTTEDSIVYYRPVYEDGTKGKMERTKLDQYVRQPEVFQIEQNKIRTEYGLEPLEIQR